VSTLCFFLFTLYNQTGSEDINQAVKVQDFFSSKQEKMEQFLEDEVQETDYERILLDCSVELPEPLHECYDLVPLVENGKSLILISEQPEKPVETITSITKTRNDLLQDVLSQNIEQLTVQEKLNLAQLLTSTITQEQTSAYQTQNLEEKNKEERQKAFDKLWSKILFCYIGMAFIMFVRNAVRLKFEFWLGLLQYMMGEWSVWSSTNNTDATTWLTSNWLFEKLLWWIAQNFMFMIIGVIVLIVILISIYLQANFRTVGIFCSVIYLACVSREVLIGSLYWFLPVVLQLVVVYYSLHTFFAVSESYFVVENGTLKCKHNILSSILNNSLVCFCMFMFIIYYMVSHCFSPIRIQQFLVLILTGEAY